MSKKKPSTDLVLYEPNDFVDDSSFERGKEVVPGLLLPLFFYLSNGSGIIAIPVEYFDDKITLALSYKVEMVRDKESALYTRLRLFYPETYISVYKSSIIYEAPPIPSAEFRYVSTLLCDRKRAFQRVIYDSGLEWESNIEFYKQRRIELESLRVK